MPDFPNEDALQGCERDGDSFGWPVVAPRGRKITGATFRFHWNRGVGPEWFEDDAWLEDSSSYCYPVLISAHGVRHGDRLPDAANLEDAREIKVTVDASHDYGLRTEEQTWTFDPPVDIVIFALTPLKRRGIPVPAMPTVSLTLEGRDQPLTTFPLRPR
jgi:hypothetical protein